MSDNCFRFRDLFAQLGLPSEPQAIAAFIEQHRPLAGDVLLADAPFWTESQSQFIKEKKATDSPEWVPLIDQLSEALREDVAPASLGSQAGRPRILGISGSLRQASFNTALLHAAQRLVGHVANLEVVTLQDIPLYDGDAEAQHGLPASVVTIRAQIAAADAILMATPEYNSGVPGVLKNALDWVSRTSADHPDVLKGKHIAVIGASPGGFGTLSAQTHWLPVLRALGMQHWSGGRLMVSKAHTLFAEGELRDDATARQLSDFVQAFARFVSQNQHA